MATLARSDWGLFVLRVVVGIIFVMHGYPKLGAVEDVAGSFASLGVPAPLIAAWFITLLETVGGAALVIGFLTPLWSLLFIAHMAAGIFLVHLRNGFYVVGPGQGGIEFNLLLIAASLCLLLGGPGALAVQGGRNPSV